MLTSTRGSSRLDSIFPWYMYRNEATGAEDWISIGKMMENGRCGYVAYLAAYHLPTVFHVLWFVHTYSQFDPQILVRACLGYSHLMEF